MRTTHIKLLVLGILFMGMVSFAGSLATLDGQSAALAADSEGPVTLQGTGATFPAPLYEKWFTDYNKAHPNVEINYQALGSGAGIKQFQQGLVNFGASDAAMTDEQMAAVKQGVVLIPMTAGCVVLGYNLPDAPSELKLSREAYAGIFLGKITQWNDPIIAKANPGAKLPDTKITVVTRSDGSGTTFVFTSNLSAISEAWNKGPGKGTSVNFPVGVAGKGNPGVAALIKETPGAIGYVEYGYAVQTGMPMATLENKSGKFVKPSLEAGQAALASVELPANRRAWIPDPPAAEAYPIVSYTWLLCYKKYSDPKILATLKSIIDYGLTDGQKSSTELGYIPLPASVISADKKALGEIS
ncbi:MAG TPA: phosphate ABC transporter substrate-binding protein PstS [Candidatus Binataceae bacterium]|nr:phosphate ABC transporter substrate-binding protein PstS [Candidatus Binataceae bacterium]